MQQSKASGRASEIHNEVWDNAGYSSHSPIVKQACSQGPFVSLNSTVDESGLAWRRLKKKNGFDASHVSTAMFGIPPERYNYPSNVPAPLHRLAPPSNVAALSHGPAHHFERSLGRLPFSAGLEGNDGFQSTSPTAYRRQLHPPDTARARWDRGPAAPSNLSANNEKSRRLRFCEAATGSVPCGYNNSYPISAHSKDAGHTSIADRMSILQKLAVPLPENQFAYSANRQPTSILQALPQKIKNRIWECVVRSYDLENYLVKDEITFTENGSISALPMRCIQPQSIVRFLNKHAISKTCYEDASTAFFTHVLPFMVSKVCNWAEYEMLEKYILRGCPRHFVRFNLDFQLFTGPKSAIHQIEMRTMVNYMSQSALATKGSVRIDDSMRDKLQQDGFFVEDKIKPHNQLLTLRRAPEQVLSQLTMDGCIGNIYWWVHSFNDYILMNRTHWKRMPALMADFSALMRHWIRRHGIAYPGTARFGCLLVAWRECCFDAEQNQSIQMAWSTVKTWKDSTYI